MKSVHLFAELIIIGSLCVLSADYLFSPPNLPSQWFQSNIMPIFIFLVIAWCVGFLINIFSELFFTPVNHYFETRWMLANGSPGLLLERLRYDLYLSPNSQEIIQRIEYHRSLIRIARCLMLVASLFLLATLYSTLLYHTFFLCFIILSMSIAYYRSLIWSCKSTYFAWLSLQNSHVKTPLSAKNKILVEDKSQSLHIVTFTGGSGFRDINMALSKNTYNITRIVPIWDNGGSSKALREHFNMLPVGDIRHALMTEAHAEGKAGHVVKLFNWRLSDTGTQAQLEQELQRFIDIEHPLIEAVEQSLRDVITTYLKAFYGHLATATSMDLRNGSIGNFILVGAYLAHDCNINTAIYVFRQLCSIHGNVWPVSLINCLHINAVLSDNRVIYGQSATTLLNRKENKQKIECIFFSDTLVATKNATDHTHIDARINPVLPNIITQADVISYGPGSFFTSVLPHIMVEGVSDTIAKINKPKLFICNLLEDNESYQYNLEELIEIFVTAANHYAKIKRPINKYITHILVHKISTFSNHTINGKPYLAMGNLQRFNKQGIRLIIDDFENPWKRGYHDPYIVSNYLLAGEQLIDKVKDII